MTTDPVREYDLAHNRESDRPITRLCTLMLSDALLANTPAIRLQVVQEDWGHVEYDRGGRWETVMQMPRPSYAPLVARVLEMAQLAGRAGDTGEIRVRHRDTKRVLAVTVENEAALSVTITGFIGSAA
jgi:hypothetical protein